MSIIQHLQDFSYNSRHSFFYIFYIYHLYIPIGTSIDLVCKHDNVSPSYPSRRPSMPSFQTSLARKQLISGFAGQEKSGAKKCREIASPRRTWTKHKWLCLTIPMNYPSTIKCQKARNELSQQVIFMSWVLRPRLFTVDHRLHALGGWPRTQRILGLLTKQMQAKRNRAKSRFVDFLSPRIWAATYTHFTRFLLFHAMDPCNLSLAKDLLQRRLNRIDHHKQFFHFDQPLCPFAPFP